VSLVSYELRRHDSYERSFSWDDLRWEGDTGGGIAMDGAGAGAGGDVSVVSGVSMGGVAAVGVLVVSSEEGSFSTVPPLSVIVSLSSLPSFVSVSAMVSYARLSLV